MTSEMKGEKQMRAIRTMVAAAIAITGAFMMRADTPATTEFGSVTTNTTIYTSAQADAKFREKASADTKTVAFAAKAGDSSMKTVTVTPVSGTAVTQDVVVAHQSLSGYVPTSRKVAGMALTGDVTLKTLTFGSKTYNGSSAATITAADLGAVTDISGKLDRTAISTALSGLDTTGMTTLDATISKLSALITALKGIQ